jgi:hypothetical protein
MNPEEEFIYFYYPEMPVNMDVVLYYHPFKLDVIQFTSELIDYPEARDILKQAVVAKRDKWLSKGHWVEMACLEFWVSLEELGLKLQPIKLLPPGNRLPFPQVIYKPYRVIGE